MIYILKLIENFIPIMYFNIGYLALSVIFQLWLGKYLKNIITCYNKGKDCIEIENNITKQKIFDFKLNKLEQLSVKKANHVGIRIFT